MTGVKALFIEEDVMGCDFCRKAHVQGCWTGSEADYCGNLDMATREDLRKLGKIPKRPVLVPAFPVALDALKKIAEGCYGKKAQKLAQQTLEAIKKIDTENAEAVKRYNEA